jgi:hypothetical protein
MHKILFKIFLVLTGALVTRSKVNLFAKHGVNFRCNASSDLRAYTSIIDHNNKFASAVVLHLLE